MASMNTENRDFWGKEGERTKLQGYDHNLYYGAGQSKRHNVGHISELIRFTEKTISIDNSFILLN